MVSPFSKTHRSLHVVACWLRTFACSPFNGRRLPFLVSLQVRGLDTLSALSVAGIFCLVELVVMKVGYQGGNTVNTWILLDSFRWLCFAVHTSLTTKFPNFTSHCAGKARSFNDLHICDVSAPEECKWTVMQAANPPPCRARHTSVVVS